MVRVWIALGSNLGDRSAHLAFARRRLAELPRTDVVRASSVRETAPLGGPPQGDYLNQMIELRTELTPRELLTACQAIEGEAGRERTVEWGPRTLDLDIVLIEDERIAEPDLEVPHPGLPTRDFWREQLVELGRAS